MTPQAQAGGEHTLLLSSSGSVLSAGACGLGWNRGLPLCPSLFAWRAVDLPEPAGLLHASYYHNLAVGARTGALYSWGCGTFIDGQRDGAIPALGNIPALGPALGPARQDLPRQDLGEPPSLVRLPEGETAAALSGGAYHSVVLTKPGNRVLTFGAAQLGQLGRKLKLGPEAETDGAGLPVESEPGPVEGLPKFDPVKSIGAGFYNTLVACKSGKLFCAGENQNQQCGAGASNLRRMTEVAELRGRDVQAAAGGYCHTLFLTRAGEVLSMGCADEGQRGDGRGAGDGARPAVTSAGLPEGRRAVAVAAGANHSVVLGEDGVAYAFGSNEYGQCGPQLQRPFAGGAAAAENDEHVLSPAPVSLPPGAGRVVAVSAGYAHTVLRTERGRVFALGQNESGQLGLGKGSVEVESITIPAEVATV